MDSRRNALDKVLLLLIIPAEAIGAQHLQRTEEHEEGKAVGEMAHWRHFDIILQRVVVFIYQIAAQLMGIARTCLP